tara:strand:- start:8215 stop:8703 length:489 start_codon:yes stop_codon:yes gene_type:complete
MAFPARIGYILEVKEQILENLKNTGNIDFVGLSGHDVEVNMMPYGNDSLIYSVYDEITEIGDAPLLFNFAARIEGNNAPRLEFIPDFVLTKDKQFNHTLNASDQNGDTLTFSVDNTLVTMNESAGTFSFTPPEAIDYEINFCVADDHQAQDCDMVKFMVKNE